ncbi:hypothetical protein EJD97_024343 [Solanum chilense]|uniref:CCHC-type domain-containing protein n=1 Tax=Solanum chilense TaxID=4083 RepID=A0A6N2C500_SOLCI|nr:hypothetical protein EJD97_024343 [Solanum chilense]
MSGLVNDTVPPQVEQVPQGGQHRQGVQVLRGTSAPKVKLKSGSGSQVIAPTCSPCGKKQLGKFLGGSAGCFGCGKDCHKLKGCPTIAALGRDAKKVPHNGPNVGATKRNHFYFPQAKANSGEDAGKL